MCLKNFALFTNRYNTNCNAKNHKFKNILSNINCSKASYWKTLFKVKFKNSVWDITSVTHFDYYMCRCTHDKENERCFKIRFLELI